MTPDPNLRASDDDREHAVSLLREHHAVGRLTAEEFNERLDKAYAAKTLGDIDALLADLPSIDLYRLPHDSVPRRMRYEPGGAAAAARLTGAMASGHGRFSPAWRAAWGSWLCVSMVCFVIWAISGLGYPWPLWVAGPWGAVLLARWLTGASAHGGRRDGGGRGELSGGPDQIGGNASDW